MQTLAKYDPYAIEQIEFFVQKKSKYTTLKSIIVSLAILALTIFLNMGVIKHLWIPRSELPLVSSSRKMSLQPFTSTYFCLFPKTVNTTLPKTTMVNYNVLTNETIKTFSVTDKFSTVPEIMKVANGRESICYDIQGAIVTDLYYLRVHLYAVKASEFDFMFKTYSAKQLIGDKNQLPNYIYIEGDPDRPGFGYYQMQVKKISAIYNDRLLIDYEPERVFGFGTRHTYSLTEIGDGSAIGLYSEFYVPFDLTDQYVLTRYNIADVLGRVLSWFSVFVMVCAVGVGPVLDFNYKVELAQKLYDNEKLNSIDISLVSYVKYLVSKLKRRLFDEEVLETAFGQLEKDLDLLNLIKRQALMKKLIKENETLNIPHREVQNNNAQFSMDFSDVLLSKQLAIELDQDSRDNEHLNSTKSHPDTHACPIVTQPDQQSGDNFFTKLIKSFDIGEVEISLISNKGEGYKTSWNTIITVGFLVVVLWFIVFAGLFKLSPNFQVETLSVLQDESLYPTATINPKDVIFRANKTMFSRFNLQAVLIDKNDEIIENLTLLNGSACDSYVIAMNETVGSGWMCLQKPITLQNDGIYTKTKLGLRLVYSGFGFSMTNIQTKIKQYDLIDNELVANYKYFKHIYFGGLNYMYGSQSIILDDPDNSDGLEFYWTLNKHTMTGETVFKGVSIELSSEFIRLKKTVPSLWDVINNAWGIVVMAFTVFLSKITRYLNVKKRENITRNEENQNRNDIVAIISTQYKLISTVFYDELKQVKYFYKTKINDWQIKEN